MGGTCGTVATNFTAGAASYKSAATSYSAANTMNTSAKMLEHFQWLNSPTTVALKRQIGARLASDRRVASHAVFDGATDNELLRAYLARVYAYEQILELIESLPDKEHETAE